METNENLKSLTETLSSIEEKSKLIEKVVFNGAKENRLMKESGIPWVSFIPEAWKIAPVYSFFSEGKNKNTACTENNLLSLSYGRVIRKDINSNGGLLPESFSTYNIVEAEDIIIRPTDLQNDKRSLRTGLVREKGIITSAYIDLKPKKGVCSSFFHYLLHAYDILKVFYNMGNGVRQGLNFDEFSKLLLPVPPIEEQREIAEYLDKKCAEIDDVIGDIKVQIETLKQYKRSIISETITKGLIQNVEMKDSGIEWIGKMPADWNLERLQWHLDEVNVSNNPIQTDKVLSLTNKLGVVPYEEKGNQGNKSKENIYEYKVAYPNTIVANSMNVLIGSVGLCSYFGCVSPVYYVFKAKKGNDIRYFNYIFQTFGFQRELRKYANGILEIRLRVSANDILKRFAPIPSLKIQREIAEYLDKKCAEIDDVIGDKEKQLDVLEEYKKSLIFEIVTGKREVK